MALDIQPSTLTSADLLSSASSKQSGNPASDTELFSSYMTRPAAPQPAPPARVAKTKPVPAKTPSDSKSDSAPKTHQQEGSDPTHSTRHSSGSDTSKPSQSQADAQSDNSAADSQDGPPTSSTAPNAPAKGRTATRGAAPKAAATQAAGPNDTVTDPSADTSNSSGLSLLQLIAKTLEGDNSDSSAAKGNAATDSSDPSTDDSTHGANDPSTLTLAMIAQAFAAAYAPPAASAAANATGASVASDAPGAADASATSAGAAADLTAGGGAGTPAQQLLSLLAKDLAATANGKTDADAARSTVGTTGNPNGSTAAGSAAPNADAIAQSLSQLGFASHISRDTHVADLKAPVGSQAWTEELGSQLTWMSSKGLESGSLRVSPEHLGPVEVQITVQNGDASVWFGANHPDTRAALEQALPQLRQMFASQGLTLSDSGVSRESPRNQGRSAATSRTVSAVSAVGGTDANATSAARINLGLVDTYA